MDNKDNPVVGLKHIKSRDHEHVKNSYWVMRKWDPGFLEVSREQYDSAMFVKSLPYSVGNWNWSPQDVSNHSVLERVKFLESRVRVLESRSGHGFGIK